MHDEAPPRGRSARAAQHLVAESGGADTASSAEDNAEDTIGDGDNAEETCESQSVLSDRPRDRQFDVEVGEQMDVEGCGDVEAGRSSEADVFDEDSGSASTSDVITVFVDPPVKYHANWDGADENELVPEGFDSYQRTYICTHGWKKRKSRSEGSRPRQHIRLTNCPFRFVAQWNLARGELQVKNGIFSHNHQVSPAAFATYPTSRGVFDPLVGARVQGMQEAGAKRSRIYDYLLEHDENVIQADVDNLVREHSSTGTKVDDNEAIAREIALFAAADPENLASVADTDYGDTGVISMASGHMRSVYARFSELLLVDCSHKTNRYNYQLLTFMGMSESGEGAVVQHNSLRVIVVDKDLNEIKVLESDFPEARVLICHFHVIKYLNEKRSKPEFGKISGDDASQIDAAVHKIVYAESEEKYNEAHESLKGICEHCGMNGFFQYFEKKLALKH
ncbi:hypothetical protein F443_09612 [Phytophthora nicotianae P1569]|uniref:ZSWIM1/3 RNaseH-like domain-containing protein n=1 Tax=Phytophthora nicotianae P1569 TaxID=1317065 RepID=V9F6J3_PHYNI|nr:hypothetical protein F443_09612 [Phytophthora nicotianae P1569]